MIEIFDEFDDTVRAAAAEAVPRVVAALATDYPAGHLIAPHRHRRHQLVHAAAGVMTVATEHGRWVVPPGRAVWVPGEIEHGIQIHGAAAMRTLYIARGAHPDLPSQCRVVAVPPLLRELILAAMTMAPLYPLVGPEARMVAVILDQIRSLPAAPLHLPSPRDKRLRIITDALLAEPGDSRSLDAWARIAGASPRTLARLFHAETGLTFGRWRQQARLVAALTRLSAGQPVTTVALDLGYGGPSAFIAMFKRAFGDTPGRFFADTESG